MTQIVRNAAAWGVAGVIVLLLAGGLYLLAERPSVAQEGPAPSSPQETYDLLDGDPSLIVRPRLPVPDDTGAVSVAEGTKLLEAIPGMDRVLTAVAEGDVDALLRLFEQTTLNCTALGRAAGPDCESRNGAVNGDYRAIQIEGSGSRWPLSVKKARVLLGALISSGSPELILAAKDAGTLAAGEGAYFIAFSVPEIFLGDLDVQFGSTTVGNGMGLRVVPAAQAPILEFSLLTAWADGDGWNALKWMQMNGAKDPVLLFPDDLSGFSRVYDHFDRDE